MSYWRTVVTVEQLPQIPGVYALYENDELVYIGSTSNLFIRLICHRSTDSILQKVSKIKYRRSVKYGDWLMYELRLITRLQPKLNAYGKKKKLEGGERSHRRYYTRRMRRGEVAIPEELSLKVQQRQELQTRANLLRKTAKLLAATRPGFANLWEQLREEVNVALEKG